MDNDKKDNNPQEPNDQKSDHLTDVANDKEEFGFVGHDDINKNLGSFGNVDANQQKPASEDVKLDVDTKVVEKAANEKINFERFTKTKKPEKAARTKFSERVSIILRSKKGLRLTWILEMVGMFVIIIVSALFIGFLTKYKGMTGDGRVPWPEVQKPLSVGLVFAWISLFPCAIPLVYLVTSWFIGINQVASSRLYHYIFWICLGISLICFLVGFSCLIYPMHEIAIYKP